MSIKVILDSNFLMVPVQFKVDIFEEMNKLLEQRVIAVVPSPIYREIKKLSESKNLKLRKQGRIALELARKTKIINIEIRPKETVDELIVRLADEWACPVATNDIDLRRKLRDMKIPVIYLRQLSHLAIDGMLTL
jgi:rRNA-processing protein FCF1